MDLFITKVSGEREPFSAEKLRNSLTRSGASGALVEQVILNIEHSLREGTLATTSDIYKRAFSLLRREERMVASRYHLKRAIIDMGPGGHPFEHFVGELLRAEGYRVEVGKIIPGACVSHEVDVVAEKENKKVLIECKFHNDQGMKSDVKTALYVHARFEDIKRRCIAEHGELCEFQEIWLMTNTKLTSDAIQYAECVGMKAVGWSYPHDHSLQYLIESSGLHPVTCLSTLRSGQRHALLQKNIVLCRQVKDDPSVLKEFNLSPAKLKKVLDEAENVTRHIS